MFTVTSWPTPERVTKTTRSATRRLRHRAVTRSVGRQGALRRQRRRGDGATVRRVAYVTTIHSPAGSHQSIRLGRRSSVASHYRRRRPAGGRPGRPPGDRWSGNGWQRAARSRPGRARVSVWRPGPGCQRVAWTSNASVTVKFGFLAVCCFRRISENIIYPLDTRPPNVCSSGLFMVRGSIFDDFRCFCIVTRIAKTLD